MERLYSGDVIQLDYKSCEMIADELAMNIQKKHPNRDIKISVAEDNENGCEIDYPYHDVPVADRYMDGPSFEDTDAIEDVMKGLLD